MARFKVAPGVRIRSSSRGISAAVGPRAARVHVGSRGVGVSSGAGPVSGYSHLSGGRESSSSGRTSHGGPTKASIAAREREAKAAAREADIARVDALETALVSVHEASFPEATRPVLPPSDDVDTAAIRAEVEAAAGIPRLLEATGGGEVAPVAPPTEPVDSYELMREHRKRAWAGIPVWRLRERIEAARQADREAEQAAEAEADQREEARRAEQARLDALWSGLDAARSRVDREVESRVAEERERLAAERAEEQAELDEEWRLLQANDPAVTLATLEAAFADNEAPAAAIDCDGSRTTVVMQFTTPEAIVPERKPARTPTGKRTLKKRTKTETNALYLKALGSNVLATVKEAFAVAPGTEVIQLLVVRRETAGKLAGSWAAIYVGEFERRNFGKGGRVDPARALQMANEAELNLKGRTEAVSPLDLRGREDLAAVLAQVQAEMGG